jgi:hypothetical protein
MFAPMRRRYVSYGLAAATANAALVFFAAQSCITVPPPDLAASPLHAPIIDHDGAVPVEGTTLGTWPTTLSIPIELFDADATFEYEVFVDYEPTATVAPDVGPVREWVPPTLVDGGIFLLEVTPPSAPLDGLCHKLEVDVANSFVSPHTPDSLGGDSIWWWYGPNGCPASWQQDGAFPADAPYDGIQLAPDSGGTD